MPCADYALIPPDRMFCRVCAFRARNPDLDHHAQLTVLVGNDPPARDHNASSWGTDHRTCPEKMAVSQYLEARAF